MSDALREFLRTDALFDARLGVQLSERRHDFLTGALDYYWEKISDEERDAYFGGFVSRCTYCGRATRDVGFTRPNGDHVLPVCRMLDCIEKCEVVSAHNRQLQQEIADLLRSDVPR